MEEELVDEHSVAEVEKLIGIMPKSYHKYGAQTCGSNIAHLGSISMKGYIVINDMCLPWSLLYYLDTGIYSKQLPDG